MVGVLGSQGQDQEFETMGEGIGGNTLPIDWASFLRNINPPATGPDPLPPTSVGTWSPLTPPPYVPPIDPDGFWVQNASLGNIQTVTDEPESGMTSYYPSLEWWEDNLSDPNVVYIPQSLPSWNSVFANYPKKKNSNNQDDDLSSDEVYTLLGGEALRLHNTDKANYNNACALRVSRALNYSGINIPNVTGTIQGADGKNYFTRPEYLKNWMTKVFGAPTIHKTISDVGNNPANFQLELIRNAKHGIYIMVAADAGYFQASGHTTLFLGVDCIHNGYYLAAKEIFFWELP